MHALYTTHLPAWAMSQAVLVLLLVSIQAKRKCLSLSAHDLEEHLCSYREQVDYLLALR